MEVKAVAIDVDGVITKIESAWRYLHEQLNLIDIAKYNADLFYSGKISYEKWAELDVALWKGLKKESFYKILENVAIREGSEEFFSFLKSRGVKIFAISGGLTPLLEIISKKFHFDRFMANDIFFEDGVVNGKFKINVTPTNKGEILQGFLKDFGISESSCIAIGDSQFDIPMLKVCGYKIAFNPKQIELIEIADEVIFSESFHELMAKVKKLLLD